ASTIQVCTAVMHYGYRIVEDMIDGLSNYLDDMNMRSVDDLLNRAIPKFTDWGNLDLNYKVVAEIDQDKCIGCQLCYIACLDGAHQCIHTRQNSCNAYHGESDHGANPRFKIQSPVLHNENSNIPNHVPMIDESECVGCNLCALICPEPGCISMVERSGEKKTESWNERMVKL
ncbi:MAG: 4Fe-4S binding protein, partial [Calditrichia bacterium]|nr:4Fe-4S binding protein [Calditrichia bacterium]